MSAKPETPAQNERRTTPKAKKKPALAKRKAEATASAMPAEPPAPEPAAPSSVIMSDMDDAALAALAEKLKERRLIQKPNERHATSKAKKKPALVKRKGEAAASAMPAEPPAPEPAAPSWFIMSDMDDAALAALEEKLKEPRLI